MEASESNQEKPPTVKSSIKKWALGAAGAIVTAWAIFWFGPKGARGEVIVLASPSGYSIKNVGSTTIREYRLSVTILTTNELPEAEFSKFGCKLVSVNQNYKGRVILSTADFDCAKAFYPGEELVFKEGQGIITVGFQSSSTKVRTKVSSSK